MLHTLAWDSQLLKQKIGTLTTSSFRQDRLDAELLAAKKEGFAYLTAVIPSKGSKHAALLGSRGFYLSDVRIILGRELAASFRPPAANPAAPRITIAGENEIPSLTRMARSLFTDSRFYQDPFFSRREANLIYRKWVENSVRGHAADIVFCVKDSGFIASKKTGDREGTIVLIGVDRASRNQGIGLALLERAMEWFRAEGMTSIRTRTQLRNLPALHFYQQAGFRIESSELIFAKIL